MRTQLEGLNPDGYYTIGEACKILDIHRNTLRRYTKQNKVRAEVRKVDGRQLYRGSELRRLATSRI